MQTIITRSKQITAIGLCLFTSVASALPFSSYDPRSQAMGGSGVAAGNASNAAFFNPALLAAARSEEDFALALPIIGVRVSDKDKFRDDLDELQDVLDRLEAVDSVDDAPQTFDDINELERLLRKADGDRVEAEALVGFTVGVPSKRWGISVFADARGLVGAQVNVAERDLRFLDVPVFSTIVYELAEDPEQLLDSEVQYTGAVIGEAGIAFARNFDIPWIGDLAVGITPKYTRIATFDYVQTVAEAELDVDEGRRDYDDFNVDLGIAKALTDRLKIGLVGKNLISDSYETVRGNTIRIEPQARLGLAWDTGTVTLTGDVDVIENDPLGPLDSKTQYASVGAELNLLNTLKLRAGYRANLADSDYNEELFTAGFGFQVLGLHLDFAGMVGNDEYAVGLQTGFRL
ncbi:MAG: conjugal transfer protein TraF [Pseudomonadota bacterium]|nr:conjugal transfer protein TraF [Pseudomonadota bacterium]